MPYHPTSTYRIQFSHEFRFSQFREIIAYLKNLGIGTVYASPIFKAVQGSEHGYDVTDPLQINPEIGTLEEFQEIQKQLKKARIGWVQDIVPNHMAFSIHNPWIRDILEKGKQSAYSDYFDIDWKHPDKLLQGKLMLPFLGKALSEVIAGNEIKLTYTEGALNLTYYENTFPVNQATYIAVFDKTTDSILPEKLATSLSELLEAHIDGLFDDNAKNAIALEYNNNKAVKEFIDQNIQTINSDKKLLASAINLQYYLPVFWKDSESKLNYRRFFTINGLISLKMEDNKVFNHYHQFIQQLHDKNLVQGLRIDHVDGMYDPEKYLNDIRGLLGDKTYLTVEKILEKDEYLEPNWPVQGETGYQFLGLVNNLLTNGNAQKKLSKIYSRWNSDQHKDYEKLLHKRKQYILFENMHGDLENLTNTCIDTGLAVNLGMNKQNLKKAIASFLIFCPVYKIYNGPGFFSPEQKKHLNTTFDKAIKFTPEVKNELIHLKHVFVDDSIENQETPGKTLHFFKRCMQFTGALMAKGGEDTAFYTFNRLLAHNEVGDSPNDVGMSTKRFHQEMVKRQHTLPHTMNATSTHDTKRGEDARARLLTLSGIPTQWDKYTSLWKKENEKFKSKINGLVVPSPNDEYFIYQSIVGAFPPENEASGDFKDRLVAYIIKALREGNVNSGWSAPNNEYEEKTKNFVLSILSSGSIFEKSLKTLMQKVSYLGIVNSIAQVMLKYTCPGIPDLYQGNESWNFNFVDPDNRRPVDYKNLSKKLESLKEDKIPFKELWANLCDEKLKIFLTHTLLQQRNLHTGLFAKGQYIPLKTKGKLRENIIAFARKHENEALIVVLPKNLGVFFDNEQQVDLGTISWKKTRVVLPEHWSGEFTDILNNATSDQGNEILISSLFKNQPFGLFKVKLGKNDRQSGTLLHVSSLPGKYGIGDLGHEAYEFADFLSGSGQHYWQMLPLNQVYHQGGYSPYSALSAFAGNTLLISPEQLYKDSLLDSIPSFKNKHTNKVNFEEAEKWKKIIIDMAFHRFTRYPLHSLKSEFELFCEQEKDWLTDYAIFRCLRNEFQKSWNEWDKNFRDHDKSTLDEYKENNKKTIQREQFAQFIFHKQWRKLKTHCHQKGVSLFGDIPIYVNYDSADVWSHPELFKLNAAKKMVSVAGVPPDYFSETGQLWGMPIFRWDVMKKNNYDWWIKRIRKNLELFDLLRLDHFRAFSAYWEVPANEETAVNGKWIKGPGTSLFDTFQKEFPDMPFVAEDLGDIDQPVYDLRDKYKLPGMRVLQFATGSNIGKSIHIPHHYVPNSIVYTGTHDNNATRGWYQEETTSKQRQILREFLGYKPKKKQIHHSFIQTAYASVAKLVIVPMQDWLGLGSESRMNTPSTTENNWQWRLQDDSYLKLKKIIKRWGLLYGRC